MEEGKIVLLRLYSGEMIMGRESAQGDALQAKFAHVLKDPRSVMMAPTMRGDVRVAIRPVCTPFECTRLEKELTVPFNQVFFSLDESEIEKELLDGYRSEVTGIRIATGGDVAVVNSTKGQGGEFSL